MLFSYLDILVTVMWHMPRHLQKLQGILSDLAFIWEDNPSLSKLNWTIKLGGNPVLRGHN